VASELGHLWYETLRGDDAQVCELA